MRSFLIRTIVAAAVTMTGVPAFAAGQQQTGQQQGGQQQSAQTPVPPSANDLRKFVVTLALGETESGQAGTFTPAATKALADMKGFLPYKTYKPLDTVYIIGLGGPHLQLKGLNGQTHEFFMRGQLVSPTAIGVPTLRLWDTPSPGKATDLLIDASFKIDLGETVVVGTSRLDGNRALLLLVTSVK